MSNRLKFPEKMDHLIRLLSTTSGADKSFMLVQYTAILLKALADRSPPSSRSKSLTHRLTALSKLLSDARTTYRLWDLISIFQWLRSLNALPASGARPVQIERLQVITMLIYYPLEHLYFLGSKGVLAMSAGLIDKAAVYSCRAWAAYTVLHFFHLYEELKVLAREKTRLESAARMGGGAGKPETLASALHQMEERKAAVINGLVVNMAYTPLTLHWSLTNGLYRSEAITGMCGLVAALAQLRAGWKASAGAR